MKAKWKTITFDECPECGNNVEVLSEHPKDDWVYDGEDARCVDLKCGQKGVTNCDGEGGARIMFIYD